MFSPAPAAQFLQQAHDNRAQYRNLPEAIAPTSVAEAYACLLYTSDAADE